MDLLRPAKGCKKIIFSIMIALPLHAVIIYWSFQFVDVPQEVVL